MRPILKCFDKKIFIDSAWKQYNSKFTYLLEPLNNWANDFVIVNSTEQLSSFYDFKSFNTEECVSSVPAWANFLHLERRKVYIQCKLIKASMKSKMFL
jgi:hypothetical protein